MNLSQLDHEIYCSIEKELNRQKNTLEMIASENFTSMAVMEAVGSVLTNKYAEGYPGKRYYGGCEAVDEVENIARDRAKELFKAEYANVQPHSGSSSNMGVYLAKVIVPSEYFQLHWDVGLWKHRHLKGLLFFPRPCLQNQ
mgnify:CR=1 FL=1